MYKYAVFLIDPQKPNDLIGIAALDNLQDTQTGVDDAMASVDDQKTVAIYELVAIRPPHSQWLSIQPMPSFYAEPARRFTVHTGKGPSVAIIR